MAGLAKRVTRAFEKMRADRIAVVRLEGVIGRIGPNRSGLSGEGLESLLVQAFDTHRLKAVALVINSPGGSPAQSEYIATRIRQLSAEKGVRVLAFCEDVAASGGYWLACAADEIYVAKTSLIGSIGVISSGFGLTEAIERLGVERRIHTAGENKHRIDPFQPEQPEDVAWLTGLQSQLHTAFIAWVKQRRGAKLVGTDEQLFNGDVWIGQRGVDLGLADDVGVMRSVLAERYPDAEVTTISPGRPLLVRILGSGTRTSAVREAATTSAVNGVIEAFETRAWWSRFGL